MRSSKASHFSDFWSQTAAANSSTFGSWSPKVTDYKTGKNLRIERSVQMQEEIRRTKFGFSLVAGNSIQPPSSRHAPAWEASNSIFFSFSSTPPCKNPKERGRSSFALSNNRFLDAWTINDDGRPKIFIFLKTKNNKKFKVIPFKVLVCIPSIRSRSILFRWYLHACLTSVQNKIQSFFFFSFQVLPFKI